MSAIKGFMKNFYYGFLAKAALAVALGLLNPRKNLIRNIAGLFSEDTISFCALLGGISGFYKFALCTMRRIRNKDDGVNALIAGAIAGLSLHFESSPKRRKFILMTLFCRSLDTLVTLLDKRNVIKKIPDFEVYMFGPVISFLIYCYFYENNVFPPGIDKAFEVTAKPTREELILAKEVCGRQGAIWFPGVAKKLTIK